MPIGRDVDVLDRLPDSKIKEADRAYLEQHQLESVFGNLLQKLMEQQPVDPVQYVIDYVELGTEHAFQDPSNGLSSYRKEQLLQLFALLDKNNEKRISLRALQEFSGKYGGNTLTREELCDIFKDFHSGNDMINQQEFLVFFSKISRVQSNKQFDLMIQDLNV